MTRNTVKFEFDHDVPMAEVSDALDLAVVAVAGIHGAAAVRLGAAFRIDHERRACAIDVRTEIGNAVARVFIEFNERSFGANAFRITRFERGIGSAQAGVTPTCNEVTLAMHGSGE